MNSPTSTKRTFEDLDDEDDICSSKKGNLKVEETALPGGTTGMIVSLRESLQKSEDDLAKCQTALEDAKSEIQKWHSAFQNESSMPLGATPEPRFVVDQLHNFRSSKESLRDQLEKAKKKEAAFIFTFAKHDQEIAELKSAARDLRAQLKPPSMQARKLLLDPAIFEEFTRLKNLVEEKDKKIKELQDHISAVNFTPQSKMGKMLMAKCRTLQEENEEIGNQANEGKMHELSMKLVLQKSHNAEIKRYYEELFKNMDVLTNDQERSNEMVLILQGKVEEKDAEIERLKQELHLKISGDEEKPDLAPVKSTTDEEMMHEQVKPEC
ncbi:hypothetical protein LIER_21708 [Lithospermum erythrorhizon]|uniref:FKBP12-interacting protein of 37 kDa n=1 Tax=Lithospermum erythrorhizon TaxID=34254 RepID=A0AAV3QWY3_LITER